MPMPHIGEKIGISPLAQQHIDRAGQAYKGRAEEERKVLASQGGGGLRARLSDAGKAV